MNYIANAVRSKGDPQIIKSGQSSLTPADRLGNGLGWFSIALGLTEIFAAGRLARSFGLEGREALILGFGLREVGSGIATLSTEKSLGLWSRVAGDALDLVTLATAAADARPRQRSNALLALLAVGGVTALDVIAARAVSAERRRTARPRSFTKRSGFPRGLAAARGAAKNFKAPPGLRSAIGT